MPDLELSCPFSPPFGFKFTVLGLVAFGVSIYAIVLHIFSIMAVHRLSGGKATAVVLLPIAIGILLILLLVAGLLVTIIAAGAIH
jgi:hypothetical protein